MRKIIFLVLFILLLVSCKKDGFPKELKSVFGITELYYDGKDLLNNDESFFQANFSTINLYNPNLFIVQINNADRETNKMIKGKMSFKQVDEKEADLIFYNSSDERFNGVFSLDFKAETYQNNRGKYLLELRSDKMIIVAERNINGLFPF